MSSQIGQQVAMCRRRSVPLVAVNTPDPAATIRAILDGIKAAKDEVILEWDVVRGMTGHTEAAAAWIKQLGEFDGTIGNPQGMLVAAQQLPDGAVLFIHQAGYWLTEPGTGPSYIQAAWNLRDQFKSNKRMLLLLAKQLTLPPELSDDVCVFDEPLPTEDELAAIVQRTCKAAELEINGELSGSVEALRGLSAFAAEQVTALSLTKAGIQIDKLWDRKRQQVEQTPGLKVFRDGAKFDQIGGCSVVKQFLSRIMKGNSRPNAVVFVDEIEKMLGGSGDTSGVSQDQLGSLLTYMQDHGAAGMIFLGPPGAAKSAIAKAAGNEGGVPTLQLDMGATKGGIVGQSEQQFRAALKVITAVSNGKSLWIATCNSIADLPPELRRRFTLGTFFFDLPTAEERASIWDIYARSYNIEMFRPDPDHRDSVACINPPPNDEGWTGAEIRQCCDIAWRLDCKLIEAAQFVVPVSRSAADKLEALRNQADGRFLSASVPGVYVNPKAQKPKPVEGRAIQLD